MDRPPWSLGWVLLGLVAGVVLASCSGGEKSVAARSELLPDMTMASPTELEIVQADGGGHDLQFTSVMNNVGPGNLAIVGDRPGVGGEWTLAQAFDSTDSETSEMMATLIWGGDGHDHWHLVGAASYSLQAVNDEIEEEARGDNKVGFCIFDGARVQPAVAGAESTRTYVEPGCGREDTLEVQMGLARGWSDPYPFFLPGQRIDVTGLPGGRYRLSAAVDPHRLLVEVDSSNNSAWVEFDLIASGRNAPELSLVGTGSSAG